MHKCPSSDFRWTEPNPPFPSSQQAQAESHAMMLEAKLRKQQEESEVDQRWLQQEESNLKKRLSLITSSNSADEASGPLSGSYHGTQSGPQSLDHCFTTAPGNDLRPTTPNTANLNRSLSRSMERSITPSSSSDEKLVQKVGSWFWSSQLCRKSLPF